MVGELNKRGTRHQFIVVTMMLLALLILGSTGCAENTQMTHSTLSSPAQVNQMPLKVTYLDVGQADCILIQIPKGENLLIDAGNNEDAAEILAYLKKQGISRLDYVIGTHPHEDHIGSLDKVIQNFEIGQILMPKVTTTTQTFKDVLTAIQKKGLKIKEAKAGLVLDLGSGMSKEMPISAEILAPKSNQYEDMNDYSVVLRLVYGQTSFLFTGDAEALSEREMIASSANMKADVLKVGHHGSSSSTSTEFLKRVNPRYAVISVGKDNTYGHPASGPLDRLKKAGVTVYRTDTAGTIIAESNGNTITFIRE